MCYWHALLGESLMQCSTEKTNQGNDFSHLSKSGVLFSLPPPRMIAMLFVA